MPEKFRVDCQGKGEKVWSNNAKEFDSKEEAETYARDLFFRWFGIESWRVVPTSTPKHELVNPKDRRTN